ncbi:MAG TPA: hemolysin family protein [Intrasporangium sp.]|uniref:hemolysin family protein n=1 Tax=Intrasporangium sp. TaxID=1925024 RepID=UPI002F938017
MPDQVSGYWFNIALVFFLVLINAAFAGSEMALISLREGQLKQLDKEGTRPALRLVRLARDPNRFLATIQIGITLAGFLASATAAVNLAEPLVPALGFLGGAAEFVAVAGVTLILTFLTLVLGELAPKRLAMQMAMPWAKAVARPLDLLSTLSRPVVWMLGVATNAVVRLLGGRAEAANEELTPEELREIVTTHQGLGPEQREIITGAFDIQERTLREVLVPRSQTLFLRHSMPVAEARNLLAQQGHSRAPVMRGNNRDDVIGVAHWAQLLDDDHERHVGEVATPALVLPDTAKVSATLRRFKAERQQLAVVIDEHGSVDGIVTLEDLLEEVVGEIYDETDSDSMDVAKAEDGSVTLPGTFPIHDLQDVGVETNLVRHAEYTTVAGLVLHRLGRIPTEPGDTVDIDGWTVEVTAVGHHAITEVRLVPRMHEESPASD